MGLIMELSDYQIKSLRFDEKGWRKLHNIELTFQSRLTLIAGINSIGKSTILGLCANCFGFTGRKEVHGSEIMSYFGTVFQADFEKLFRLTPEDERNSGRALIFVEKKDGSQLIKGCSVDKRPEGLRVVPRTVKIGKKGTYVYDNDKEGKDVGPAQKVPFPTLYLGMSRMWPLGESANSDVKVSDVEIHEEDAEFIHRFIHSVIPFDEDENVQNSLLSEIAVSGLSSKTQRILQPKYKFPTDAISLGQGGLGAIATALASFNKLKRELGDAYPGGLFVIDELDSALHPAAQIDLINELLTQAKKLKLQIIATSHSLETVWAVDQVISKVPNSQRVDKILYLSDSHNPKVQELTYSEICDQLRVVLPNRQEKSVVYLYTEDDEAKEVLSLIKASKSKLLSQSVIGIKIKICSLKLGNNQLQILVENRSVPHFKLESVSILDGDVKLKKNKKINAITLPTLMGPFSPELEFLSYVETLVHGSYKESMEKLSQESITTDHLMRLILKTSPNNRNNRNDMKNWYNSIDQSLRKKILKLWLKDNQKEVDMFCENLRLAVQRVKS